MNLNFDCERITDLETELANNTMAYKINAERIEKLKENPDVKAYLLYKDVQDNLEETIKLLKNNIGLLRITCCDHIIVPIYSDDKNQINTCIRCGITDNIYDIDLDLDLSLAEYRKLYNQVISFYNEANKKQIINIMYALNGSHNVVRERKSL